MRRDAVLRLFIDTSTQTGKGRLLVLQSLLHGDIDSMNIEWWTEEENPDKSVWAPNLILVPDHNLSRRHKSCCRTHSFCEALTLEHTNKAPTQTHEFDAFPDERS